MIKDLLSNSFAVSGKCCRRSFLRLICLHSRWDDAYRRQESHDEVSYQSHWWFV